MVTPMVDTFLDAIKKEQPFLGQDALSPTQLRAAADFDIKSGILNTKDFPEELESGRLRQDFIRGYQNVMRTMRVSAVNVFQAISTTVPNIPAFYPSDPVTSTIAIHAMPSIQAVANADVETNSAHYNLRVILSQVRDTLRSLGGGLPSNLSPDLEEISNLAQQLEATSESRDEILNLFKMEVPKNSDIASSVFVVSGAMSAVNKATQITTTTGKAQRTRYAQTWLMILHAQKLAIEAVRLYYQSGGRNVELFTGGPVTTDSLPSIERNLVAAHDAIRNTLSDTLVRAVNNTAFTTSAGLDGAQVAEIVRLAGEINNQTVDARGRNRETRESFSYALTNLETLRGHALNAFNILISP